LSQYLIDCTAYQKQLFDEWTLYPNGIPRTLKMAFSTCEGTEFEDSLLIQVIDNNIQTDPGSLHGIQALLHTSSLISIFDKYHTLIYANPAFRTIFTKPNIHLSEYICEKSSLDSIVQGLNLTKYANIEAKVNTMEGIRWHSMRIQQCLDPTTGSPTCLISATDVTEERASKLDLTRQAFTDSLTGLMNRHALVKMIDGSIIQLPRAVFIAICRHRSFQAS